MEGVCAMCNALAQQSCEGDKDSQLSNLNSNSDADYVELVGKIRSKFRMSMSLLGIHSLSFPQTTNNETRKESRNEWK